MGKNLYPLLLALCCVGCVAVAPLNRLQLLQNRCIEEAAKLPALPNVHFNSDIGTLGWAGSRHGGPNEGPPEVKSFSVLSYGFQEARRLATLWSNETTTETQGPSPADATSSPTTREAPDETHSAHSSLAATTTTPPITAPTTATATTESVDPVPEGAPTTARKPGRPRKTKDRRRGPKETSDCAGHVDSSAPEEDVRTPQE